MIHRQTRDANVLSRRVDLTKYAQIAVHVSLEGAIKSTQNRQQQTRAIGSQRFSGSD